VLEQLDGSLIALTRSRSSGLMDLALFDYRRNNLRQGQHQENLSGAIHPGGSAPRSWQRRLKAQSGAGLRGYSLERFHHRNEGPRCPGDQYIGLTAASLYRRAFKAQGPPSNCGISANNKIVLAEQAHAGKNSRFRLPGGGNQEEPGAPDGYGSRWVKFLICWRQNCYRTHQILPC